jgi:hypothetical protein
MTVTLGAVFMFVTSWRLACLVCGTLPPMLVMFRTYARECALWVARVFPDLGHAVCFAAGWGLSVAQCMAVQGAGCAAFPTACR